MNEDFFENLFRTTRTTRGTATSKNLSEHYFIRSTDTFDRDSLFLKDKIEFTSFFLSVIRAENSTFSGHKADHSHSARTHSKPVTKRDIQEKTRKKFLQSQ
jgi:hypothetical protein